MAGLCESGNEPPGSLKANEAPNMDETIRQANIEIQGIRCSKALDLVSHIPTQGFGVAKPLVNHGTLAVQQRIFCVEQFVSTKSIVAVQHEFRRIFGDNQRGVAPSRNIISVWVRQWRETGSVQNKARVRQKTARTPDNVERVRTVLQRSLCLIMSDEANFCLSGYVNKQDFRYWAPQNPREIFERPLHSPKVVVWCAVAAEGIIGPYFFEDDNGAAMAELQDSLTGKETEAAELRNQIDDLQYELLKVQSRNDKLENHLAEAIEKLKTYQQIHGEDKGIVKPVVTTSVSQKKSWTAESIWKAWVRRIVNRIWKVWFRRVMNCIWKDWVRRVVNRIWKAWVRRAVNLNSELEELAKASKLRTDSFLEDLQKEVEELRELANNRLQELDKLHQQHRDALKEVEKLKMDFG
ncbi:hypothetical protein ANN_22955 [Periplaneta americana]|uniref:DUF4817 domain-containing protein n=1 Tax=Periplaneta americana TaxID=6978 RepID=A0ABQ8SJR8_PERAM|nr:hypothetical protein ANN_22955 [Periplaneta americana]